MILPAEYKGKVLSYVAIAFALILPLLGVALSFLSSKFGLLLAIVSIGAGGFVILLRPKLLVISIIIMTLLVSGPIVYNTSLDRIWWADYLLAAALYIPVLAYLVKVKKAGSTVTSFTWALTWLLTLSIFTSLLNQIPSEQIVVSIKTYVLFGGLWVAMVYLDFKRKDIQQFIYLILIIGLIQILPVLYQYLFVRSSRSAVSGVLASDSVVGTFGGSPEGGGQSALLALFLIIVITFVLSFYRQKLLKKRIVPIIAILFIPLLFVEAKATLIFIPVALAVVYKDYIRTRPLRLIGIFSGVFIALMLLILSLQVFHWNTNQSDKSLVDNVVKSFSYSFAEKSGSMKQEQGVLSRYEVLLFWWEKHHISDPLPLIIGHGVGASRTSGIDIGEQANRYYPKWIDRTTFSMLLWDIGLIGAISFYMMLLSAYYLAGKYVQKSRDDFTIALSRGVQAIMPLFGLITLYRNDLPYSAPAIFLFYFTMGLLAWIAQQAAGSNSVMRNSQRFIHE